MSILGPYRNNRSSFSRVAAQAAFQQTLLGGPSPAPQHFNGPGLSERSGTVYAVGHDRPGEESGPPAAVKENDCVFTGEGYFCV